MVSRFPFRGFVCLLLAGLAGCMRPDPVEMALKKLKDPAATARLEAINTLGAQHDPRAFEPLIACLDDQDMDVRMAAFGALGALGDNRAIEPLTARLPGNDPELRKVIISALEKLDHARASERLLSLLPDKNADAARTIAVIEALGTLRDPRAVDALMPRLADENEDVSGATADALGRIGPPAVAPLIVRLKDPKARIRGLAAQALGQTGDTRAVPPLIDCLKHPAPETMESPPENTANDKTTDENKADAASAPSPADDNLQVRQKAAEALGQLGAAAVEPLISCLQEQDPSVRSLAATALGQLRDARALQPLISALIGLAGKDTTDEENAEGVNVRQSLLDALPNFGDAAIKPLAACLENKDVHVRRDAAEVLDKLHYQPADVDGKIAFFILRQSWNQLVKLGAPAVAPLVDCLKDEDSGQRQGAAEALGELNDKRAVGPLIGCLQDDILEVRQSAARALGQLGDKRAVGPLINIFKNDEVQIKVAAAEALGALGDDQAVSPLIEGLKDGDAGVRQAAAQALDKLHYQPAQAEDNVTYLIALQAWGQLAKMGPAAFGPLTACLSDDNLDVRQGAVETLGDLGDKRAIAPLSQALPDWDLNAGLVSALAKLGWKPASDAEQVYAWIGAKDSGRLKQEWEKTRQVLLD
ncbi:MAG TPA: HEAT repeat domain-containing protein, partial [Opitutaceae bacterium]|nr:HEAT repeat domain-containing protein [Opitutaceae bacterium]